MVFESLAKVQPFNTTLVIQIWFMALIRNIVNKKIWQFIS